MTPQPQPLSIEPRRLIDAITAQRNDALDRVAALEAALTQQAEAFAAREKEQLAKAVDRFLSWRLPDTFAPDGAIQFHRPERPLDWPVGTNLLDAEQARAMFAHALQIAP